MEEDEIRREYKKMLSKIEDAQIYDGRGIYDLYECRNCGNHQITLYKDKGVTPFAIGCTNPECEGLMQHTQSYKNVPETVHVLKWVRPTLYQTLQMSYASIKHVLNGGLVLETNLPKDKLKISKIIIEK